MAVKLFARLNQEALETAIDSLEAQLLANIQSVSNPIVGGGSNFTPDQTREILGHLYAASPRRPARTIGTTTVS